MLTHLLGRVLIGWLCYRVIYTIKRREEKHVVFPLVNGFAALKILNNLFLISSVAKDGTRGVPGNCFVSVVAVMH